jgi:hypothetical protein
MLSVVLSFGSVIPEAVGYVRIGLSGWLATATGSSSVRAGTSPGDGAFQTGYSWLCFGLGRPLSHLQCLWSLSNRAMFPNGWEQP